MRRHDPISPESGSHAALKRNAEDLRAEIASLGTRISVTATMAEALVRHRGADPADLMKAIAKVIAQPRAVETALRTWTQRLVLRAYGTLLDGYPSETLRLLHLPDTQEYREAVVEIVPRPSPGGGPPSWADAPTDAMLPMLRARVRKRAQELLADLELDGEPGKWCRDPKILGWVRMKRAQRLRYKAGTLESPPVRLQDLEPGEVEVDDLYEGLDPDRVASGAALLDRLQDRERIAPYVHRLTPLWKRRYYQYLEDPSSVTGKTRENLFRCLRKAREAAG